MQADEVRSTGDVDVVSLRTAFKPLKDAAPWARYGFEFVFDRRRYVKLRHVEGQVDVDINLATRVARLLSEPTTVDLRDLAVPFTSPAAIAFAKLRTQRQDWTHDPARRLQDRADLIRLVRNHPQIVERMRHDEGVTDEMRSVLADVARVAAAGARRRGSGERGSGAPQTGSGEGSAPP
ncbi:MAG: hypothetical protein HRF43_07125 [Phycisphaerae bacterium]